MPKIRVGDIAKKMGIPEQDLIFKLKSIGVRVEGDEGMVDLELIQAVLSGKKVAPPQREVILRDKQTGTPKPRRPPQSRAVPPPGQRRQTRRRAVVSKTDKIRTLPSTEPAKKEEPVAPPEEVVAKREAPAKKAPVRKAPTRPEPAKETRKKSKAERVAEIEEQEDLSDFRGSVDDLEALEEEQGAAVVQPARRTRRAERKREQKEAAEAGKMVSTRDVSEGPITVSEGMRVRDLADKLGVKTKDLIKTLMERGIMATVNHVLEPELAIEIAEDLGFEAMAVSFEEEVQLQQEERTETEGTAPRAPVVTVMGHVDHGKTTLLDTIRSTNVTEGEHGGITQHIAAYHVDLDGKKIVFLDTPGHEAFTQLRARGAKVTDIVVLVVAADDGVMPQTKEAIAHARAADVPIIVAINKMDRPDANADRVKKELSDNELLVEDWGGDVVAVPLSALKGDGIDDLLEMILLQSEILELKADPELHAHGVVLEARKEPGRGVVATALIQDGSVAVGDIFVSGATWGRVRLMVDDRGNRIEEAGPSTPVEISGFQDIPAAGDSFQVVEEESKARQIAEFRQQEQRQRELAPVAGRMSLESLFERIEEGEVKELPVVVKADVQGSIEVLRDTLEKLSTDKVKVRVIHSGVGAISTNDVLLASASEALIYGFNVRPERNASDLADKEEVEIRTHTVIYELVDELKKAMAGLLEPTYREVDQGRAEVRETFKVPKIGTVAGCHVVEGVIPRSSKVRLLRDNVVVFEGRIASLRRFKDDVSEVRSGFDCGIGLESYQDVKPGDVIEAFVEEAVAATL